MGTCPITNRSAETIDYLKELPDNYDYVDGNEYMSCYKKDLLYFVKNKTVQRVQRWHLIPVENGELIHELSNLVTLKIYLYERPNQPRNTVY